MTVTPKKLLGKGKSEILIEKHLDPRKRREDRCWIEIGAQLDGYENKKVIIELVTRMKNDSKSDYNTAGWATPVIVEKS